MKTTSQTNYTPYQLKLPLELSTIIETTDAVYTFCEVIDHIDLNRYIVKERSNTGRPKYDAITLLKVILFAFMENGYASTREIEKYCKTDIRYMWLLQDRKAPSHMTIDNFMNDSLANNIQDIFKEISSYIVKVENVDLSHTYIDGTKIVANANKYSWVWKKSCIKNRDKTFDKVTVLLEKMNEMLLSHCVKFEIRQEYTIEYLEEIISQYKNILEIDTSKFVRGRGHHKSTEQIYYETLLDLTDKLKKYSHHIRICGESRNSYSKTDQDATFMRMKTDYMGNDQLLPGYNVQLALCDEYIAAYDVQQYASDMDCFQPLMNKFNEIHGSYPEYPIADAGYGSFDNYLFCEEHNMKKYMKFTMFAKETEDPSFHSDPFRAVNFQLNDSGNPVCPNNREFHFLKTKSIKGNHYGRTEELWMCEDCSECPHTGLCKKAEGNRIVRLNRELSGFHREVIHNLESVHGALLRMNRSIQAEGAFGGIKWNRMYTRARRRGLKQLILEMGMISCGFNMHKYHLKKLCREEAA